MEFRTIVNIPRPTFELEPCERILFVGSCFADNIGKRFEEEKFRAVVNPFGVMYNPVSVLHTARKMAGTPFDTAVFTLGTNHVYVERATGEIVDNCQKRPQREFEERELTIDECADALREAISLLRTSNPQLRVIVTVSPIRYAKYGYHESQLSKAVLLLAADKLTKEASGEVYYFPAYEIVNDELRDYRFYKADMLHPNEQAVALYMGTAGGNLFLRHSQAVSQRMASHQRSLSPSSIPSRGRNLSRIPKEDKRSSTITETK